jgi:hypothetical protein
MARSRASMGAEGHLWRPGASVARTRSRPAVGIYGHAGGIPFQNFT